MVSQENKNSIFVLTWGATMRLASFFMVKRETAKTVTVVEMATVERQTASGEVAEPEYDQLGLPVFEARNGGRLSEFHAKKICLSDGTID